MDLKQVSEHYAKRKAVYVRGAQAVDWKNRKAQMDRLNALRLLFVDDTGFTLNDWGCGYGEMGWLVRKECARYHGYDILPQELDIGTFHLSDTVTETCTYTVASGLFNVRGDQSEQAWTSYVHRCVCAMNKYSHKGFAFNCLSDRADRKSDGLYYANAYGMARHCMDYGRVSLLQHYSAWDFTILVNKC